MQQKEKSGTLWRVCQPGIMAVSLTPFTNHNGIIRYGFEKVNILEKDAIMLYLGDETFEASHLDLFNIEAWEDEVFNVYTAALFLVKEQKVYIFYNDYYNLWDPSAFFEPIK